MDAKIPKQEYTILAILGIVVALALLSSPTIFAYLQLSRQMDAAQEGTTLPTSTSTGAFKLGELNSQCGGRAGLPCKPGLTCSASSGAQVLGTCQVATSTSEANMLPFVTLGQSCNAAPCDAGLYCQKGSSGSVCAPMDAQAPHVTSLKVEGASFEQSIYRLASGTSTQVTIQALNTAYVTLRVVPIQSQASVSAAKQANGGNYTAQLTLERGFRGRLEVTVRSKSGDSSSVSIDVASSD